MRAVPVAITIAGSDSGGGAGIEADLKTFMALGVHGAVAITSVTAQNTYEVTMIHDLPPEIVAEQIRVVYRDTGIDAGKTGMLSNKEIIHAVAETVEELGFPLVVDPVMVAKSGARLLREDAIDALIRELLPRAVLVTPNIPEAEILSGMRINGLEDMMEAARTIVEKHGAEAAVVKGGHLGGSESVDVLYYRGRHYYFKTERIETKNTHGTGCSFSAAIAALLAKNYGLVEAVGKAKEFITTAIKYSLPIGRGHGPVNPAAWIWIPAEKYRVLSLLEEAVMMFLGIPGANDLVPEVGTNIVYSLPALYARTVRDVAGVEGRITRGINRPVVHGMIRFGASSHMARLVLAAQRYDPRIRAAANIRYDERMVERAREKGYSICYVDRRVEPVDVKKVEGSSIPWILGEAVKKARRVPDIIYDHGDYAREPMIRVLGEDPVKVVEIIRSLAG